MRIRKSERKRERGERERERGEREESIRGERERRKHKGRVGEERRIKETIGEREGKR